MAAADLPPRLGYACISMTERAKGVFCSRTVRLQTVVAADGTVDIARLQDLARENIADLLSILNHNDSWGCRFFRITSNLFPHWGNPRLGASARYDIGFAEPLLRACGDYARKRKMRITAHPGQFAQLGAQDPAIVAQTYTDLGLHARVFAMMGLTPEDGSCMVIHGGGVYGDKDAALRRFAQTFAAMPAETRQYVVLENDEFNYSLWDLLPFCEREGIPLVVDYFHHSVWSRRNGGEYAAVYGVMDRVVGTWRRRGLRPKCHYSEQRPNSRDGAHSDCIEAIPDEILRLAGEHGIDIMLEVKDKDTCARMVLDRQFEKYTDADGMLCWRPKV